MGRGADECPVYVNSGRLRRNNAPMVAEGLDAPCAGFAEAVEGDAQEPEVIRVEMIDDDMAMDLRRRNKQDVMETMDGKTPAPRAHQFAATFTSTGWITSLKVVTRPRDVLMGHNPRNQWLWRA